MAGMSLRIQRKADLPDWQSRPPPDIHALQRRPPSVIGLMCATIEREREDLPFFRPSSFGGCRRSQIFHYLKAPAKPQQHEVKMQMILDTGTHLHPQLQGYLERHPGVFFSPEVPVWIPELEIKGSADGIISSRVPDSSGQIYRWGVEFKTIGEKGFNEEYEPLPKKAHVVQASIYARLAGVWWITIVYYNKNSSAMKEYHVHYDPEVWQGVVDRVQFLKGHINRKSLPLYDVKECKANINFCPYVETCHNIEGKEPPKSWKPR